VRRGHLVSRRPDSAHEIVFDRGAATAARSFLRPRGSAYGACGPADSQHIFVRAGQLRSVHIIIRIYTMRTKTEAEIRIRPFFAVIFIGTHWCVQSH